MIQMIIQLKSGFFALLYAREKRQKTRQAKKSIFDKKLRNKVATSFNQQQSDIYIHILNSRYNQVGYNEIPAYNEVVY